MRKSTFSNGVAGVLTISRFRCVRRNALVGAITLVSALPAWGIDPSALPTGGSVAGGAATISQSGARMNVQQQSNRAILNWNTFNIGSQAAVSFQQPGTASVVLNRVMSGGGVSEIYGSLTANGQVFLVNPAGALFGRGAQVNVGGLVASSLDITNENFLKGNYKFSASGSAGAIVNQGTLSASDGGYIALLSPQVRNEGVIAAQLGTVAIGAGNVVTLDIGGTGLVSMQVDQAAVDALIENKGLVQADGGIVYMSARAAGQLAGGVINNSGEIHAATVTERNGVIRLEAGDVANSGSIVADGVSGGHVTLVADNTTINSGLISAQGSEGKGGEIRLLGDKVGVFGSGRLDGSGETGGGTVLIGGAYQGKGPEQNASRTVVDSGASIHANATANGDGGKVIVWADELTRFSGSIEAKGGPLGGNGGFVETSGKSVLQAFGSVDASAPKGIGGTWLLDPNNITISTNTDANRDGAFNSTNDNAIINNIALGAALTNGTTVNVTTQSAGSNTQAGDISVQAGVTAAVGGGQTATLNLIAQRNIDFAATGSLGGGAGILNVSLRAGTNVGVTGTPGSNASSITMAAGSSIVTNGGYFDATAKLNGITLAAVNTGAGSISVVSNGGAIGQASAISAAGPVTFNAGANTITLTQGNAFGNTVSLSNTGSSNVSLLNTFPTVLGTSTLGSGTLSVVSAGPITQTGVITQAAGAGATSFSAGASPITLTNGGNDFTGQVTLSNSGAGNPVSITDANTISFGNGVSQSLGGNFTVTAPTIVAAITDTTNTGSQTWNGNVTFAGSATTNGGAFVVTGTTTLAGPWSVTSGAGNATFTGAVNGAHSFSVSSTGAKTFNGAIGATTPLASLNTNSGGTTAINGGSITTSGSQIYGAVTLGAGTTLAGNGITFNSTVNGAHTLAVNDSGTTAFVGAVGGTTPLLSLGTNPGGATNIIGGLVQTSGGQNYGDTLFLSANTTLNAGGAITINNAMNSLGNITLSGNTITEVGSGAINTTGTLTVNSTNGQTLNGPNTVGAFNASNSSSGSISLINSATILTVTGISHGPLSGSISVANTGNIVTTGAITAGSGAITLNATNGNETINAPINAGGGAINLSASGVTSGSITLNSNITNTNAFTAIASRDVIRNAGSVNSGGSMTITAGRDIGIYASTASANLQAVSSMALTAGEDLTLIGGGATNAFAQALTTAGAQNITANFIEVQGGTAASGGANAQLRSGGNQTVSAGSVFIKAGISGGVSGAGNFAQIRSDASQSVTVGAGGLAVIGGGGGATNTDNFASLSQRGVGVSTQTINVHGGGPIVVTGGSSGASAVGAGHGSRAFIEANGASQQINFTSGGALNLTGGTVGSRAYALVFADPGTQTITGSPTITLTGGSSGGINNEGNDAEIYGIGAQSITASNVTLSGGSGGSENYARIGSSSSQTLVASGIHMHGGSGGGGLNSGNSATISAAGNQNITVGSGGITMTGGSGPLTDNFASLFQSAAVAGTGQTITVNGGGSISLTGGSTAQASIGGGNGNGSFAFITTDGVSQLINFTSAGSAINITGGTVGSKNSAGIYSRSGGIQTISGSPGITVTGGASGGANNEANSAGIFTDGGGSQTITSGNMTVISGAGGIANAGFVQAPTQNIVVHGNLTLVGGGSAPSTTSGAGVGFGGRGGATPGPTDLVLTVDGDLTATGGSVSGVTLGGGGVIGGQPTGMTINVGGNVTLNPGSGSGARIGSPLANLGSGTIAVTAGGAIALNDSATQGAAIGTLGSVTLQAASISGGSNGISRIAAAALTTASIAGATALPTLAVGSLSATSTGGSLNLGNGAITGNLVAVSNGNAITESGALTVGGTANITAGAAPITLTSANDFQGVVTLSNSGAGNPVSISDANTITFNNQVLGGSFTVNAPTIIAHDTTNTGNQTWNGNVTFNSTETTNGGNFVVTGITTLGSGAVIVTGAGNVTLTGPVVGTTAGGQNLVINSSGTTTFGSTVGTVAIPLASIVTDPGGSTFAGGNITTAGPLSFGDLTTGGAGLLLTSTGGGQITVNQASTAFPQSINTTGNVLFTGTSALGSAGSPLVFVVTPSGLQATQPISLAFASPTLPANLVFVPGSAVSGFIGGSASPVILAGATPSAPPAVSAIIVATVQPDTASLSSSSPTGSTTPASSTSTSSTSVAASTASAATAGPPPAPLTAAASTESGTTRLTSSSGVSKETIRQIDQQISQARTQMFSPALNQLNRDPTVADVPDCSGAGQGTCVKQGKPKSPPMLTDAEPVIKRRVALLFGNDKYLAPIPVLQTPIHDVEDIGKVLKDKLGYEVRIVRNASKDDIVNELNNLVTSVDEDDSVFVYYAGHGYQSEKGGGGYWIPVDANNSDASSWISNSAISKFLANMASRQVMLISDSCYSGTLAQEQKVRTTDSTVFDRKEILRKRSVLVMSSGGNEPVADGGHDNHSLFAYHLIKNLNQIEGDLVGGDIHERVRNAIVKEYPQDPQYGAVLTAGHAEGGEYLIEKK